MRVSRAKISVFFHSEFTNPNPQSVSAWELPLNLQQCSPSNAAARSVGLIWSWSRKSPNQIRVSKPPKISISTLTLIFPGSNFRSLQFLFCFFNFVDERRSEIEWEFVELCSDLKGIMSALQQIREKAHKDGQKKNQQSISRLFIHSITSDFNLL